MADDNRHILQAAEEKLERMSAEIGRLHNELDRYSRNLVERDRECEKLQQIAAKNATGMTYSSYDAAAICRVIDERDAYRKALEEIYQQAGEGTCAAAIGAISKRCIKVLGYDKEEA
jgi:predicted phage gp36 major capsid-like protein